MFLTNYQINLRNRKVIITLHCGLSREEYNEIEHLRSAKEIWECLKTKHEGTSESNDEDTDGEVANLCFMALEEPSSDEVTLDLEFNDEMLYACEKLTHKCDKYLSRITSLKEIVKALQEKLEKSRFSNEELTNSLNECNSKKIEIANENAKLIEQNAFLEI